MIKFKLATVKGKPYLCEEVPTKALVLQHPTYLAHYIPGQIDENGIFTDIEVKDIPLQNGRVWIRHGVFDDSCYFHTDFFDEGEIPGEWMSYANEYGTYHFMLIDGVVHLVTHSDCTSTGIIVQQLT